jgi:putative N6-adenine-specific DNA methylase
MHTFSITIKTFFGLEDVLIHELNDFGFSEVTKMNRAVQLKGTWEDVYFLNVHLRTALSILVELSRFGFKTKEDIYKQASKVAWNDWFSVDKTFSVKGAVFSKDFSHSQYPMLIVKDAIVDHFREKKGNRPNVELKHPQILIDVYIQNNDCILSINTSGTPLYQRGYRSEVGEAPLNEVVAAGLLYLSGWDKKSLLIDPFCGSGTIAIEAALMATNTPPNAERQHYAFKNLRNFNRAYWDEIAEQVRMKPVKLDFDIMASDISQIMVTKAKRNIRALPVSRNVQFFAEDFKKIKKFADKGTLICNPPYGERMGENLETLYKDLGDWFKSTLSGFDCWLISSNESALKSIGLRPERKIKLFNGNLECSFRKFSMYSGSKKDQFSQE